MRSNTRKVAQAVVLVAIGATLGRILVVPLGLARAFPAQHLVNVVGAVLLGPWWAMAVAAIIGVIRNAAGTGSVLAFPGGMIGAFLAGVVYRRTRNIYLAALGEVIGTGIIAALVSWWVVVPFMPEEKVANTTMGGLLLLFSASTIVGSVLGILALKLLERVGYVQLGKQSTVDGD